MNKIILYNCLLYVNDVFQKEETEKARVNVGLHPEKIGQQS